jgi:integrase
MLGTETVWRGNFLAMKIRPAIVNGEAAWCLDLGTVNGRRTRRFFPSRSAAAAALRIAVAERAEVGNRWAALPVRDRAEAAGIISEIREAGLTLAKVWAAYQAGNAGKVISSMSLGKAISALLTAKRLARRREVYLANLEVHLRDFARGREGAEVASISLADLQAYLARAKSLASRQTRLNRISTLFSFAVRQGWLAANPCQQIERMVLEWQPPRILSVDECRALLLTTREHDARLVPHVALCLFAGVRPAEARRLSWADIDIDAGLLRIEAAASKVRQRRVVELPSACVAWLRLGGDLPAANVRHRLNAIAKRCGLLPWPRDGLRHSAASYWHALHGEVVTARNLGHSEAVLHRHYRALVTPAEAQTFFEIVPRQNPNNINTFAG